MRGGFDILFKLPDELQHHSSGNGMNFNKTMNYIFEENKNQTHETLLFTDLIVDRERGMYLPTKQRMTMNHHWRQPYEKQMRF